MSDRDHLYTGCLYFTAGALARVIGRMADEAFRPTGLSPSHAFLLMTIADEPGIGPVAWGSDGGQSEVIIQTPRCEHVDADHPPVVQMQGQAVFRWAPFAMADLARQAVKSAGLSLDDLDAFIPHQANLRITQLLVKNLGLSDEVAVATDIVDSGNTSAASVPLFA